MIKGRWYYGPIENLEQGMGDGWQFAAEVKNIVGNAITNNLLERDWTQAEGAEQIGISASYLSDIILGKRNISPDVAMKLSEAFGIDGRMWLAWDSQDRFAAAVEKFEELEEICNR